MEKNFYYKMLKNKIINAYRYWKDDGTGRVLRVSISKLIKPIWCFMEAEEWMRLEMLIRLGYWPNLKNPRSFNEKLINRLIFKPHPLTTLLCDKWRVRKYVSERVGEKVLNEVFWVGDNPKEIPFDSLPDKFVIKANNGSGSNIFINNKNNIDKFSVIKKCDDWLNKKHGYNNSNYKNEYYAIKPLILIEKKIEQRNGDLVDYKFFCFHGSATYVQVDIDRHTKHTRRLYDMHWNDTEIRYNYPKGRQISPPINLEEMKIIAEKLCVGIDFVRVDLYSPDDKNIFFGEMTLRPEGGYGPFWPRFWDYKLGELW